MERGPGLGTIRTAWMKSEIIGRRLEMPQRQATLSESARDRKPLLPEPCGIVRSARGHVPVGVVLPDRYPAQFAQDIFAITNGQASANKTEIALTEREAWCAVSSRRAPAHGNLNNVVRGPRGAR